MSHGASIPEPNGGSQSAWLEAPGLSAVRGLVHGFTTRAAGSFSAGPPAGWPAAAGGRRLRLLRQVHGAAVVGPEHPDPLPEADAWAGRPPPGVLLGVRTADCVPVILCHPRTRTLAVVHAGWRGTAAGVVTSALEALGAPRQEVVAAVGPAIGGCCYEVGPEVVRALGPGPWATRAGRRWIVDLRGRVEAELVRAGVPPGRIERVGGCTGCGEGFFSHRARADTGRMLAFAGWREP
ncbi:polyphenol oxidase family protein [Deferrisoma camini]|uniref:polyphenol oxidase family protein n=1 Tax=Deferrisoma camini TaxID=1035120 RepID=UPI0004B0C275|nr:polyphenol oxidase family protein [Deferrisoma camini]